MEKTIYCPVCREEATKTGSGNDEEGFVCKKCDIFFVIHYDSGFYSTGNQVPNTEFHFSKLSENRRRIEWLNNTKTRKS